MGAVLVISAALVTVVALVALWLVWPPRSDDAPRVLGERFATGPIGPPTGNAMVIVEPRTHDKLQYVVENFDRIMDPSYDLYVFHGKSAGDFAKRACANVSRRTVFLVPLDTDNLSATGYNALLKSREFYDAIRAENILVFQTDTALCSKSPLRIADFEGYGYVGCSNGGGVGMNAAWGPDNAMYGVGGLSFRKKSTVEACLAKEATDPAFPEDVFFSNCVEKGYGRKPENEDVLNAFCTQNVFRKPSFGMHKVSPLLRGDHRKAFLEHCPEAAPFFRSSG